jgi:hypothetical protein
MYLISQYFQFYVLCVRAQKKLKGFRVSHKFLNLVFFLAPTIFFRRAKGGTFSLSANYAKYCYMEDNVYTTSNHKFQFEYQLYLAF